MYNDEEELISRNYLIFLEERFSFKTLNETNDNNSNNNNNARSTFGCQFSSNSIIQQPQIVSTSDPLIIKAKLYIIEILEVHI